MTNELTDERIAEIRDRYMRGQPSVEGRSIADVANALEELQYLRYFFEAAGEAFGPADADVYCGIAQDYEDLKDRQVPPRYDWRA